MQSALFVSRLSTNSFGITAFFICTQCFHMITIMAYYPVVRYTKEENYILVRKLSSSEINQRRKLHIIKKTTTTYSLLISCIRIKTKRVRLLIEDTIAVVPCLVPVPDMLRRWHVHLLVDLCVVRWISWVFTHDMGSLKNRNP